MNGSPGSITGLAAGEAQIKTEPQESDGNSVSGSSNCIGLINNSFSSVKPISPEQEELIQRLVFYQNAFEQPNEEDVKKISVS